MEAALGASAGASASEAADVVLATLLPSPAAAGGSRQTDRLCFTFQTIHNTLLRCFAPRQGDESVHSSPHNGRGGQRFHGQTAARTAARPTGEALAKRSSAQPAAPRLRSRCSSGRPLSPNQESYCHPTMNGGSQGSFAQRRRRCAAVGCGHCRAPTLPSQTRAEMVEGPVGNTLVSYTETSRARPF